MHLQSYFCKGCEYCRMPEQDMKTLMQRETVFTGGLRIKCITKIVKSRQAHTQTRESMQLLGRAISQWNAAYIDITHNVLFSILSCLHN
jgi:hypothetical protein